MIEDDEDPDEVGTLKALLSMCGGSGEDSTEIFNAHSLIYDVKNEINTCACNLHYNAKLSTILQSNCIVDAGADTHVVGKGWKPIVPITDTNQRADVVGFDDKRQEKGTYQ